MLRDTANSVLGLFAIVGAFVTIAGLLAPLIPEWEMVNHFRPFITAGFLVITAAALMLRARLLCTAALVMTLINGALFLVPASLDAHAATAASGERFRFITFNVLAGNHDFDVVEAFLREQDADVVVLQEVTWKHGQQLLPALRDLYPHQLSCDTTHRCNLAILSKTPWAHAEFGAGDRTRPPLVWARFGTGEDTYVIAGTHFVTPFLAGRQVRNAEWLAEWSEAIDEPLIIAGDFNLTPFSWRLTKFALDTGLRRYATYQASWPAISYRPAFLIDHIFSTDEFHPLDVRTGPELGSDHLPVIAEIVYRGRQATH